MRKKYCVFISIAMLAKSCKLPFDSLSKYDSLFKFARKRTEIPRVSIKSIMFMFSYKPCTRCHTNLIKKHILMHHKFYANQFDQSCKIKLITILYNISMPAIMLPYQSFVEQFKMQQRQQVYCIYYVYTMYIQCVLYNVYTLHIQYTFMHKKI